jgi:hypothetical protein
LEIRRNPDTTRLRGLFIPRSQGDAIEIAEDALAACYFFFFVLRAFLGALFFFFAICINHRPSKSCIRGGAHVPTTKFDLFGAAAFRLPETRAVARCGFGC